MPPGAEKKPRTRSPSPNKTSAANMRSFVKKMAALCPHFMGGKPEFFDDPKIEPETLLARVIAAIDYTPSSINILANLKDLARAGVIEDKDLSRMTVRQLTFHCSRTMLNELEAAILEHEGKLVVAAALEPPFIKKAGPEDIDIPETEIIIDPMLGRIEVDSLTGELVRVVPDTDAAGEVIVDDTAHVTVDTSTETAKQSKDWGSW